MNAEVDPNTRDREGTGDAPVLSQGRMFAGRYRIEELLGIGGFANVYRAEQTDIGREVAIKVLDPDRISRRDGLSTAEKRFYREARLMSKLEGPNTVRLYDYGRTREDLLYTVFEYIDGTDLDDLMRTEAPFDEQRTRRILRQILRSLHEAHAKSILHRDVKPGNVMVFDRAGERDRVKLLDFGIAKMVAAEASGEQNLTVEGMVVGTPRYMSPEQTLGRPLGPPSDLFGVGLLVYEMLVGSSPFDSAELSMVRRRIDSAPIRLPMGVDVSDELRDLTNRLLVREVEDRVQSTREALEALGVELADADDDSTPGRDRSRRGVSFPIGLDSSGVAPVDDLTGTTEQTVTLQSKTELPATGSGPAPETPTGSADPAPFEVGPTRVDPDVGPPTDPPESGGPPDHSESTDSPPGSAPPKPARPADDASARDVPSTPSTEVLESELVGTTPSSKQLMGVVVALGLATAAGWWLWQPAANDSQPEPDAPTSFEASAGTENDPREPQPDDSVPPSGLADTVDGARTRIAASVERATRQAADVNDANEEDEAGSQRREPSSTRPTPSPDPSPSPGRPSRTRPDPPAGNDPAPSGSSSSESEEDTEIKPIDEYLTE